MAKSKARSLKSEKIKMTMKMNGVQCKPSDLIKNDKLTENPEDLSHPEESEDANPTKELPRSKKPRRVAKQLQPLETELQGDDDDNREKLPHGKTVKTREIIKKDATATKQTKVKEFVVEMPPAKKLKVTHESLSGGMVLTVGMGDTGQLGLGPDIEEKKRPSAVSGLKDIIKVAAGGLHSACLDKDGKVYTWGCNDEGALGRLTSDEEDNFVTGIVPLDAQAIDVTAGDCHTAILTDDGKVYGWGSFRGNSGHLGFLAEGVFQREPVEVIPSVPIVKIASGNNHLVMLSRNGEMYTCGCGEVGQLGRVARMFADRADKIGSFLKPTKVKVFKRKKAVIFEDIWAGGFVTFAKSHNAGDIYGFGLNNYCQLGDTDRNSKFQPVILKKFGQSNWVNFSAGQHHSLACDDQGKVFAMGRCDYGRLGFGEGTGDAEVPTPVGDLSAVRVICISAGECSSFVVTDEGQAYSFGMGSSCQLGLGDEDDRWSPALICGKQLENRKVVAAMAGGQHTIFLVIDK